MNRLKVKERPALGQVLKKLFLLSCVCSTLFLSCTLPEKRRDLVQSDWNFAQTLQGDGASRLHRQVFGDSGLSGKLYRDFFEKRIERVEPESRFFSNCNGAIACHIGGKTVQLAENFYSGQLTPIARLSLLIHEARHTDGFRHSLCPKGIPPTPYSRVSLEGKRECDTEALGAYGVQIVMLRNIEKRCLKCTPETRAQARDLADFLLHLIISREARASLEADK